MPGYSKAVNGLDTRSSASVEETVDRWLNVSMEVGRIINSASKMDHVYRGFASQVKRVVDYDLAEIDLIDVTTGRAKTAYTSCKETLSSHYGQPIPFEGTATGYVVKTHCSLLQENPSGDSRFWSSNQPSGQGYRSRIMVPLVCKGRVVATFTAWSRAHNAYGNKERDILEHLVCQLVFAVENASLEERLQAVAEGSLVTNDGNKGWLAESERTKEALQENEELFRCLVEHAADAFFLHDLDGRILDVNQRGCESLEYSRQELLGLSISDIVSYVGPAGTIEGWKEMDQGVPVTVEGVYRRKTGATFPVEVRLGLLEWRGHHLVLALARDITERKRAEKMYTDLMLKAKEV